MAVGRPLRSRQRWPENKSRVGLHAKRWLAGSFVSTHPAGLSPADLLKACSETRTKRSRPGGQHRNKTETAVVLVHRPTGISAESSERRSQAENRSVAIKRLRLKLAIEHREPANDRLSESWQRRVPGLQLVISAVSPKPNSSGSSRSAPLHGRP
ncbi:MAG: peptide chain release factor family protein [Planctomycetia bacterium]